MLLRLIMALLLGLGLVLPVQARTVTVTWPMTLEYPFIRSALIAQVYTLAGDRALAAQADGGCTRVELWAPQAGPEGEFVKIGTRVRVRAGVRVLGRCLDPISWEGYIELRQRVTLDPATWELRFHTVDSTLYDRDLRPATVGGVVWNLVKKHVHAYLDQFTINLAPPVKDLEIQLPLFFTPAKMQQVKGWLESLRPGPVRVEPGAVKVMVRMQVESPPPFKEGPLAERPLTPEQRDRFIRYWEAWDAYLVHQVLSLAGRPLSREDKTTLLSVILETRHSFLRALAGPRPGRDLVRRQFLRSWRRLAPIFRRQLSDRPSPSLFSYLAYFTASDALAALDALGPALGLDISRQGLVRLARLVDRYRRYPSLEYSYRVNDALRSLLDLGPPLEPGPNLPAGEELILPAPSPLGWLVTPAWAGESPPPLPAVRQWLPPRGEPGPYLERLRRLLAQATQKTLAKNELEAGRANWFYTLVQATAWQESCWRQFLRRGKKITYLRSYNRSSVGLMQINERVWRGIFQPRSLRWDIAYNARAGCQILALYTTRYALAAAKKSRRTPSPRYLAQLVYALYNGGPRQLRRFPRRLQKGRLFLSDRLFLEKYLWVNQGDFRHIHKCLGSASPSGS